MSGTCCLKIRARSWPRVSNWDASTCPCGFVCAGQLTLNCRGRATHWGGTALKCNLNQTESVIDSLNFKNVSVVLLNVTAGCWVCVRGLEQQTRPARHHRLFRHVFTFLPLAGIMIMIQAFCSECSQICSLISAIRNKNLQAELVKICFATLQTYYCSIYF
jgi:hypothetical protein